MKFFIEGSYRIPMKQKNSCPAIRKFLFGQSLVCAMCVFMGVGANQNSFSNYKIVKM